MVDKLTPVQQQTEVGEGLAVGCLVVGVSAMTSQDGPLESAFAQALASWPLGCPIPVADEVAEVACRLDHP